MATAPQGGDRVRTAELIAALCLATDLGMGFPFEHGLERTLIAMRLANALGVRSEDAADTYYACLLAHAGCTTEEHIRAEVFGGSLTANLNPVIYGSQFQVIRMLGCDQPYELKNLDGLYFLNVDGQDFINQDAGKFPIGSHDDVFRPEIFHLALAISQARR